MSKTAPHEYQNALDKLTVCPVCRDTFMTVNPHTERLTCEDCGLSMPTELKTGESYPFSFGRPSITLGTVTDTHIVLEFKRTDK